MLRSARWALLAGLIPLAACNMNPAYAPAATVPAPQTPPSVSAQDQAFVDQAITGNIFEIRSAQLALDRSRNPRTRAFARRLLDSHTQMGDRLREIASRNGLTPPSGLGPEQEKRYAALENTRRIFDSEFFRQQAFAHQDEIATFQMEARSGYNTELKQFAQDTLPMLQDHLQQAEAGRRMPMGRTPARR